MLVLRTLALLLVLAALLPQAASAEPLVLVDADGRNAVTVDDPALPSAAELPAPTAGNGLGAAARAAAGTSVPATITRLRKRGQLDADTANQYRKDWSSSVGVAYVDGEAPYLAMMFPVFQPVT